MSNRLLLPNSDKNDYDHFYEYGEDIMVTMLQVRVYFLQVRAFFPGQSMDPLGRPLSHTGLPHSSLGIAIFSPFESKSKHF